MEATAGNNTDGNMSTDEDGRGTPTPPSTTERATTPSGPAPGPSDTAGTMLPPSSPVSREQLTKRIDSLSQQNRVLKCELETYKLRVKSLQEENRHLRQASVHIQAKAEQEEEFISNTLLKKIQALKKEKENLALNYEQEEECLTNDLSRKLDQLRQEKVQLEHTLEQEQECLVNKLMRRIEKLETETTSKQTSLDNLRREKVELENTLEQEQEALVNKLWKRMDQLETEKRSLQVRLDKPVSEPESPRSGSDFNNGVPLRGVGGGMGSGAQAMPMPVAAAAAVINLPPPPLAPSSQDTAANLANHIRALRQECARLKKQLEQGKQEHEKTMAAYAKEEKEIREENLRLQRRLQLEMERREALCRHLSESESSLEMEEERVYNEMSSSMHNPAAAALPPAGPAVVAHRTRTLSSPVPGPAAAAAAAAAAASSRPLSPGLNYGEGPVVNKGPGAQAGSQAPHRLHHAILTPPGVVPSPSPPPPSAARRSLPAGAGSRPFPGATPPPPPPPPLMPSPVGSSAISMGERRTSAPDEAPPASPMDTSDNNGSIRPRINTQKASPNT